LQPPTTGFVSEKYLYIVGWNEKQTNHQQFLDQIEIVKAEILS
jgi:hypothetical protein